MAPARKGFISGAFDNQPTSTVADSICVDVPRNGIRALGQLKRFDGAMMTVSDTEIITTQAFLSSASGLFAEPAGAGAFAGFIKAVPGLDPDALVVILSTGNGVKDIANGMQFAGYVVSSGSGGTLGAGYYLKHKFPRLKIAAAEALQCPTLLNNGFGAHRIEGIGDKHVPWVHDCKDTDFVIAVDDEVPMRILRLFNESLGRQALIGAGVDPSVAERLDLLGISGIGNMVAAIKFAKYNELTEHDVLVSIATDSMQLYRSRLEALEHEQGVYTVEQAQRDLECIDAITIDHTKESSYYDRKAIHNLKYYTWIEQQGRPVRELDDQWYDHDNYWQAIFNQADAIDELIVDFNQRTGLI